MLLLFLKRLGDVKDVKAARIVAAILLLWEAIFSCFIILKISYTEIDWVAYMEQVESFQKGERDYFFINGQTGPCVYPAGFLYFFSFLHWLTLNGDIYLGQITFLVIYLLTQAIVFELYIRSESVPPWALCLLCLSKRMHSIYVLRLFNDCVAMIIAYGAMLMLTSTMYKASILLFSLAVSIKMNILLMAPSVLVVLSKMTTLSDIFKGAIAGAILQFVLGLPFLLDNPTSYITQSFNLGRVFMYKWTVNFKFLPESIFLSKTLAGSLLCIHVLLLLIFYSVQWRKRGLSNNLMRTVNKVWTGKKRNRRLHSEDVLWIIFTGNFIGIICARSLHYQFYSWYFHSIPFLLWSTTMHTPVKLLMFFGIEFCWNVYPSTALSSTLLLILHSILLYNLLRRPAKITGRV